MPMLTTNRGRILQVSDEDYDWAAMRTWRAWAPWKAEGVPGEIAVCDETSAGRRFRLQLHREIAARMSRDVRNSPRMWRVRPINGDFLDCRRENLELVRKAKSVRVGKPRGYQSYVTARGRRPTSRLWCDRPR
jgi:hypothetical protein